MLLLDILPQRFATKIKISESGCWQWIACKSRDGYGRYGIGRDYIYAHRYAYELFYGTIPTRMQLDHLCHNNACVNPEHLEQVTPRVNVMRSNSFAAKNMRKTVCVHGHKFDLFNTYFDPHGKRYCRKCDRIKHAQRWERNQLAQIRR